MAVSDPWGEAQSAQASGSGACADSATGAAGPRRALVKNSEGKNAARGKR